MLRLNSLILIFFLMLHQKAIALYKGHTKIIEEEKISSIKKDNERLHSNKVNEIAVQNSTIFHYDFSDLDSYNRQTTSESNKTINDLSGNNNYGTVRNISKVYFDSEQNAMFFNGKNDEDATGISINNLNYVSGPSDQLESFTIQARIKAKSELTNHGSDERIIISFDRSAVFRLSIGSDADSGVEGKLVFGFANEDGSHTSFNSNQSLDLRDDQWHDIAVQFKANTQNGLKLYIDGNLIHSDPNSYKPIGGQDDNETPRYGNIGNGSEMQSATGTTNPDNMFFGWILSMKFSSILEIENISFILSQVAGPISNIISKLFISVIFLMLKLALATNSAATTTSCGKIISHLFSFAFERIFRDVSFKFFSHRDFPICSPFAKRKVLAIPPPIIK